MTSRKWLVASSAIALSGALHAAALGHLAPNTSPTPDLSAGGAQAVPLLGDSFADMAVGAVAAPVAPVMAPKAAKAPSAPLAVSTPAMVPVVPTAIPLRQLEQAQPVMPEAAAKPAPQAVVAPVPDPIRVRPQQRPEKAKPAAKPKPKAVGNSDRNRKKGVATGSDAGKSSVAKATGGAQKGDGGKAAASYGSVVLRKISRTRKANAPAKGRAVVGFVVAANGGLQSVRIVTSSGNAGLDKVALDHIRRAAPFAAPPTGAQRQFAFEFLGKR